jgi:hypothetical protein
MTAPPSSTKTIRFTEAAEVDYLDGAGLRKYAEGSTHTMRSDKADRWIRRSKAVDVTSRETVDVAGPAVLRQPDDQPRAPVAPAASPAQPVTAGGAMASGVPQHGNTVASAQAVGGADGGSDGQRAVNVGNRRRSGPGS